MQHHPHSPIDQECSAKERQVPRLKAPGVKLAPSHGIHRPQDQTKGQRRSKCMQRQGFPQLAPKCSGRGAGEEAGGAGHPREGPQGATQPWQMGLPALQPEVAREGGRQQVAGLLDPGEKATQRSTGSAIYRAHNHVY